MRTRELETAEGREVLLRGPGLGYPDNDFVVLSVQPLRTPFADISVHATG